MSCALRIGREMTIERKLKPKGLWHLAKSSVNFKADSAVPPVEQNNHIFHFAKDKAQQSFFLFFFSFFFFGSFFFLVVFARNLLNSVTFFFLLSGNRLTPLPSSKVWLLSNQAAWGFLATGEATVLDGGL